MLRLPFLPLLLCACQARSGNFPQALAEAECDLYARCDVLDAFGGTLETCVDAVAVLEASRVESESCNYDRAEARDCLSEWEDASCARLSAEVASACDLVCAGGS